MQETSGAAWTGTTRHEGNEWAREDSSTPHIPRGKPHIGETATRQTTRAKIVKTPDDRRREVLIREIVGYMLTEKLAFVEMLGTELRDRHAKRVATPPQETGLRISGSAAVAQPMRQPDDPDSGPPKAG